MIQKNTKKYPNEILNNKNFQIIRVDEKTKSLLKKNGVDFSDSPITFYVGDGQLIKWAQIGYDKKTFRISLWTITH